MIPIYIYSCVHRHGIFRIAAATGYSNQAKIIYKKSKTEQNTTLNLFGPVASSVFWGVSGGISCLASRGAVAAFWENNRVMVTNG